jgi:thymidine kinase
MNVGTITSYVGPMFAGKTTELTRLIEREQIAKREYIIFNSYLDKRYGNNHICTHQNKSHPAHFINKSSEMYPILDNIEKKKKPHTIFIDEVMFFNSDVLNFIEYAVKNKSNISCFGLDMTSEGKPFPFRDQTKDIGSLLAISDKIVRLSAVCTECGNDATRTYCKSKKTDAIKVGGQKEYIAMCKPCWYSAMNNS